MRVMAPFAMLLCLLPACAASLRGARVLEAPEVAAVSAPTAPALGPAAVDSVASPAIVPEPMVVEDEDDKEERRLDDDRRGGRGRGGDDDDWNRGRGRGNGNNGWNGNGNYPYNNNNNNGWNGNNNYPYNNNNNNNGYVRACGAGRCALSSFGISRGSPAVWL
jgi:hypothetical protein